jgi:hypothetical protein
MELMTIGDFAADQRTAAPDDLVCDLTVPLK